ncbi:hypothetical protein [Celeribacter sp.]|uniref:hypothetical protein n=1 Tax=Celeribacter sp. TaxID=1890673 RepID=UPI003A8D5332
MATLSSTFQAFASDAGDVAFEMRDDHGEWAITQVNDPASVTDVFKSDKGKQTSMTLVYGEFLMLRGRGEVSIVGDNLL